MRKPQNGRYTALTLNISPDGRASCCITGFDRPGGRVHGFYDCAQSIALPESRWARHAALLGLVDGVLECWAGKG